MVPGPIYSKACGIFLDQGWNPCIGWQVLIHCHQEAHLTKSFNLPLFALSLCFSCYIFFLFSLFVRLVSFISLFIWESERWIVIAIQCENNSLIFYH